MILTDRQECAIFAAVKQPRPAFRRVCSWCSVVMAEGSPGAETSHGMCPDCELRLWSDEQLKASEAQWT